MSSPKNGNPWLTALLILLLGGWGLTTFYFYQRLKKVDHQLATVVLRSDSTPTRPVVWNEQETAPPLSATALDRIFITASQKAAPSVVFIKGTGTGRRYVPWGWDWFWGGGYYLEEAIVSSGSGVIIHPKGYIVTNYHVVKNAENVYVIFPDSKKEYPAHLVGTDPSTDIALLKVERDNLPAIPMGNSDSVRIGQWVLAIGNPFNLTSSVTAGIVSAKGRRIDVNSNSPFSIESFIQTDAAINPGNSGGALVDLHGKLVGINTAILSKTGSYIGYGFAVPINIVRKVVEDLIEFGFVQRAFIPAHFKDVDDDLIARLGEPVQGIFVINIPRGSLAGREGLHQGDIIIAIDGHPVRNRAEFDERLALRRPGDRVPVTVLRNGQKTTLTLTLTNAHGQPTLARPLKAVTSKILGARIRKPTLAERERLGIRAGVVLEKMKKGSYLRNLGVPEGAVLYAIDTHVINDPEEVDRILNRKSGRVLFKLIYPDGSIHTISGFLMDGR